jgi:hypothetical protein
MRIPGFDFELPTELGKVRESYTHLQSKRSVACIGLGIPGGHLGHQQSEENRLLKIINEQAGRLLDTFVKNGVRVICLEGMEGRDGHIDAMGPSIAAVLRSHSVAPFGVDNLTLERQMMKVLNSVAASRTQYQRLFLTFSRVILSSISQHTSSMMVRFITLREQRDQNQVSLYEVSSELNQLSQALNIRVPTDIRRALIALSRLNEIDEKAANQEQNELLERLKKNAEVGVFDPEMMTTFRRAALEAGNSDKLNERFRVEFSPVRLKEYELRALNYARAHVGLELGGWIPQSVDDLQVWQSASSSRRARFIASEESHAMFESVENLEKFYNVAHMLGVDMQAYPQLCKYAEHAHMLLEFGGRNFLERVLQIIEQAWDFFEKHIPKTLGEKRLMTTMTRYRLLRKLSLLQLTPTEYDHLIEDLDDCSLSKVIETLTHLGISVDTAVMHEVAQFDQRRDFLLSFYDNARQRANSMALRTLERMDKVQANQAVLICLGFHLPTIKSVWSGQPVSYSILLPHQSGSQ